MGVRFFQLGKIVDDGCEVWTPSELKHLQKHRRRVLCETITLAKNKKTPKQRPGYTLSEKAPFIVRPEIKRNKKP